MDFIADLVRWFWKGKGIKNGAISQVVSMEVPPPVIDDFKLPVEKIPNTKDLDLEPKLTAKDVLGDLQSLQSLNQQFDRARQELVVELQKLAPPKKRNPFWNKDAA
jgi:hypothetical protein